MCTYCRYVTFYNCGSTIIITITTTTTTTTITTITKLRLYTYHQITCYNSTTLINKIEEI